MTTTEEVNTSDPIVTTEEPETDEPGTVKPQVPTTEPTTDKPSDAFKYSIAFIFLAFSLIL